MESRNTSAVPLPPWFAWLAVAAILLLPVACLRFGMDAPALPLLSLGEWMLLPLSVLSLAMGLHASVRLWLSAVLPALLWIAVAGFSLLYNGIPAEGGTADLFLAWTVRLVAPALVFLPLLAVPEWRDRLMLGVAGGPAANAAAIFWQARIAGVVPPDASLLGCGGFLPSQYEYGVMLGLSLPLLVSWRGGGYANKALATLLCTFLLPVLALSAVYGWPGLAVSGIGLVVAWAAWRRYAWVLGIFLCLLLFGYGSSVRESHYRASRQLLAGSAAPDATACRAAFAVFTERPFLGTGVKPAAPSVSSASSPSSSPWYASLLGGTGLLGLGMWMALLGEMAGRAVRGKRCLWHGGVLGGMTALLAAGVWGDVLSRGAGSLVGLLLAVSILEEPEAEPKMTSPRSR